MRAVSMIHGCIGNDLTSGQPNGLQQPLLMRQGMCVYVNVKGRFLCYHVQTYKKCIWSKLSVRLKKGQYSTVLQAQSQIY